MATKNIEPNLRLIGDYTKLSKDDHFQIPEYQRGYSWTTVHCDKLWQDIETYIESGEEDPYFFGTVIIDCSTSNTLKLIDGQQRTTTFLLLLKALHLCIGHTLHELEESDETRALKRALNNSYFRIFEILYKADEELQDAILSDWKKAHGIIILENRSINELYKSDFQKIIEAKSYDEAERSIYRIPRKQKDNKYTNFFRNFKFFYEKLKVYKLDKLNTFAKAFLNKCQIIEIKSWQIEQAIAMFNSLNSTGMPLSDADIISAQLYSHAKDTEEFIDCWEEITQLADFLNQCKVTNIDGVLQQFMYIQRSIDGYKQNQVTTPGIRKYYTLDKAILLTKPMELCASFKKILDIWDKIKDYPVVKLLLKFNENFKMFLISYLNRFEVKDITKAKVTPIAECLIRLFALMEAGNIGYSSSYFKTFLFNENMKLVDTNYPISKVKSDFDKHISETWKKEHVKEDLEAYDKNILVFLNEYLYAKENNITFDFNDKVNVEHIMPASGHNVDSIRIDAGISTLEEFDEYANLLGNKILLEEDINKSIGNDWFKTKKGNKISEKKGYIGSSFGLAQYLAKYPKNLWKKKDISLHTENAANRIIAFIFND